MLPDLEGRHFQVWHTWQADDREVIPKCQPAYVVKTKWIGRYWMPKYSATRYYCSFCFTNFREFCFTNFWGKIQNHLQSLTCHFFTMLGTSNYRSACFKEDVSPAGTGMKESMIDEHNRAVSQSVPKCPFAYAQFKAQWIMALEMLKKHHLAFWTEKILKTFYFEGLYFRRHII